MSQTSQVSLGPASARPAMYKGIKKPLRRFAKDAAVVQRVPLMRNKTRESDEATDDSGSVSTSVPSTVTASACVATTTENSDIRRRRKACPDLCHVFSPNIVVVPPAQYFPAPSDCLCVDACPDQVPLAVASTTGPQYRVTPAEIYTLKASATDTGSKAEIFELFVAEGMQTLWLAPQHTDTYYFVRSGDVSVHVSNKPTVSLGAGEYFFAHRGTPYGLTKQSTGVAVLLGIYLPPGLFGYHVEALLQQCDEGAADFDSALLEKYGLVSGYTVDYRNPLFCVDTDGGQSPCAPPNKQAIVEQARRRSRAIIGGKDHCGDETCEPPVAKLPTQEQWMQTMSTPAAVTLPLSEFPYPCEQEGTGCRQPLRPYLTNAISDPVVFSRANPPAGALVNSWEFHVGVTETKGEAEIALLALQDSLGGVFLSTDVFFYVAGLAETDNGRLSVTIGTDVYPALVGGFYYVPRGSFFNVAVQQPMTPGVVVSAQVLVGFLGGGGTFGFFRNSIQVQNIADAGTITAVTAAQEIEALGARYCMLTTDMVPYVVPDPFLPFGPTPSPPPTPEPGNDVEPGFLRDATSAPVARPKIFGKQSRAMNNQQTFLAPQPQTKHTHTHTHTHGKGPPLGLRPT